MTKKQQQNIGIELIRSWGFGFLLDIGLSPKVIAEYTKPHHTPAGAQATLTELKRLGIPNSRIVVFYHLLQASPAELQERYDSLKQLGFSDTKIQFHANLLGREKTLIEQRYSSLKYMGFSDEIVQRRTELLLVPSEMVQSHYKILNRQGLTRKKNTTLASLLAMDPKNVVHNNLAHKRFVSRRLLEDFVQLNAIPPDTIEANVQFAYALGIPYDDGFFLGTHPQTKRKKMAWMLTHATGYKTLTDKNEKKQYLKAVRAFVFDHPEYLKLAIRTIETRKDELYERLQYYIQIQKGVLEIRQEWNESRDNYEYSIVHGLTGNVVCTARRTDNGFGVYLEVEWQPHPASSPRYTLKRLAEFYHATKEKPVERHIKVKGKTKDINRMRIKGLVVETGSEVSGPLAAYIANTQKDPLIIPELQQALRQLYTLEQ